MPDQPRFLEPNLADISTAQTPVPGTDETATISLGDLRIELEEMRAFIADAPIALTAQEFELLVMLARDAGSPVQFGRLALGLWQDHLPSAEQKRHLSVLMARLRAKLAGSKQHRLEVIRKRGYGLMPASNNKIEFIKSAKDGLDVLEDIYRYADAGGEIDADDLERMKWYGLFHRKQTPGFFMLRLRIPNGVLTSDQITEIGRLSNRFGRGEIDITTRQNIQLRWLRIQDVPEVFQALDSVGLDYRQSGMDNVRNITGCPMAGLDTDELLDASPVARAIQDATIGGKEFSNLPRKFNISVSGCRHDCATSQLHDLSLTPATKGDRAGFNVRVGGALGGQAPRYASDLDVFLTPEQAPGLCASVAAIFRDEGPRENRQNTRLKVLIEEWGLDRFRQELEVRFGPLERAGTSQLASFAGDHIGVSLQKQEGLRTLGCMVPVGRLSGDDLIGFGRLAGAYGSGELRLTNNQNMLIVNVPAEGLQALLEEPLLQKYSPQPPAWLRRTVACTGKDFCHFSLIDTKARATEFAASMERLLPMNTALRVHWSGCQHGCGQHSMADVGLMATHLRSGNEFVEAVDVFLGGRVGDDPRLATKVLDAVPMSQLPQRMAELLERSDYPQIREAVGARA